MIENKLVITVECNRCGNQAETKTVAAVACSWADGPGQIDSKELMKNE